MKYLVIFVVMSIAGTFGFATSVVEKSSVNPVVPIEFIDILEPIYITPSA